MGKITPFLWFNDQAEEAANLYVSIFKNSRITSVSRYGQAGPGAPGSAMTVQFELDGRPMTALNGGPVYRLTEAFSLSVACEDQAEIDRLWDALLEGGQASRCGWLKDRFGLSWQIVPANMGELLGGPDPAASRRATEAMFKMVKLDIAALKAAREG